MSLFGKKFIASHRLNIQVQGDADTPWIAGCTVMPGGHEALLCDHRNDKIKLISLENPMKMLEYLPITKPWDVCAFDATRALITQPNQLKMQLVHVKPCLKIEKEISFDQKCWGVSVVNEAVFISFHSAPGNGEVRVMDIDGTVKRVFGKSLSFEGPSYISMGPSGKLYVSDFKNSLLVCILTSDDRSVYQYKNPDLFGVRGVFADAEGNAVVCGRDTNNVYVVSSDGKAHKTLLPTNEGVPEPCCVACRLDGETTLLVGCYKTENLYFVKLA